MNDIPESVINFVRFYFFAYRNIVEHEGPRALFRGLGPNIVGVAPSRAIYFSAYSQAKKFFNAIFTPDTAGVHICSASFAGKILFCTRICEF